MYSGEHGLLPVAQKLPKANAGPALQPAPAKVWAVALDQPLASTGPDDLRGRAEGRDQEFDSGYPGVGIDIHRADSVRDCAAAQSDPGFPREPMAAFG